MSFPERVYTAQEHEDAKKLVDQGYKHNITVQGEPDFKRKVEAALELIGTAGYMDFFKSYIRDIKELDGLTQLRETEVAIWANKYAVENPVDAASLFIQKAYSMKEYLEGELYYGGAAEKRSILKRIEFLQALKQKSTDAKVKEESSRLLDLWQDNF